MNVSSSKQTCITIGNFDGVHLGHQSLISLAEKKALDAGLDFLLITFWPHPRQVIRGSGSHMPLLERQEKLRLLCNLGANTLELEFTHTLSQMSAEEFVASKLLSLGIKELVVGHDFTLGRKREGDLAKLADLGARFGFNVTQAPAFTIDGLPVSSTRLRSCIAQGRVGDAAAMLGRRYTVAGLIGHGFGRGKGMGFPTANLEGINVLIPGNGVYATYAHIDGHAFPAVTNIGMNPTFGNKDLSVETFILDADLELYEKPMQLEFVGQLRTEQKFESASGLGDQINKDITIARQILSRDAD